MGVRKKRQLRDFITYRISRLNAAMNAEGAGVLRSISDLSLGQWRMLLVISANKAQTSKDIVEDTQFDPALVSRLLRQLEEKALLRTWRAESDRRLLHLALTDKGQNIVKRAAPVMAKRQKYLLADFDEDEKIQFFKLVGKLEKTVSERRNRQR